MRANLYVHGLLELAMFTALVLVPDFELLALLLLELPPHAANPSAATATSAGTVRLRRSRLID
jgi:hypothetical protein